MVFKFDSEMKSSKSKSSKKKSKSPRKMELNETKHDAMKEKSYITREIETSITLLESPEDNIVLESLLFLSKYADIERNNLNFLQSRGLLPKLLALFDHNICILRLSLRLISLILTVDLGQLELNEEKYDEPVLRICEFYINHPDLNIKEFSITILVAYSKMGKAALLLTKDQLIKAILKTIKSPESDTILNNSLELFNKFIEFQSVRTDLPHEENFNLELFITHMSKSEESFDTILNILEKMTYFGEDDLQIRLKECKLIENVFDIIIDPLKVDHLQTCLNIVTHCMGNKNTNSYFVESLEFLKFCQWVKTCPEEFMLICANIFLELAKINSIRQMLFDLSVEDVILSFFRSNDKKVLNTTCDALSVMSKHKYCCEKIITPVVLKKLIEILGRTGDAEDPYNETALSTLHYLCKRDSKVIHMIRAYDGIGLLMKYLNDGASKLSGQSYGKVLEIINMFVTNNQLQKYILSPSLYEAILAQIQSKSDEICMRSLEIMINCLNHEDFRDYFLLNKGSKIITNKLLETNNENIIRFLVIFVHNSMMYENLASDLIYTKLLLTLKKVPESFKYRIPLIGRAINLILDMCLPLKFFETGRLELVDKLNERFYLIAGPWFEIFPFLEVLELRQMSTRSTIYVVDYCGKGLELKKDCYTIHQQNKLGNVESVTSLSSASMRCSINYGKLSHDPYLLKYIGKIQKLLTGISAIKDKIKVLAKFIDSNLCGPKENSNVLDKLHSFKLHIECIKEKLGTNMIPIGYLRLGFHCERALLFKALADQVYIPATLVKGKNKLYWNEIALIHSEGCRTVLKLFVVDLMNNIGQLLPVGSRECNAYCDIQ